MPIYIYECPECEISTEEYRTIAKRNDAPTCECGRITRRNVSAEQAGHSFRRESDWTSINAGVGATQIDEANRTFGHLGVWFDREGSVHGSGGREQKLKFLQARGLVDRDEIRGGHN